MLTKITIRNFKCFNDVEIELGNPVVFIGPNNSGKSSALQALTLWDTGLNRWAAKEADPEFRKGQKAVAVNRLELVTVPVPDTRFLWHASQNSPIEIIVEGIYSDVQWEYGLEFHYANEESFYCGPLRVPKDKKVSEDHYIIPALETELAFLPPMSGLTANEPRLERGAINVRIGEGRTSEVLRNLCYHIFTGKNGFWNDLKRSIDHFFDITLEDPLYIPARGEIAMNYRENKKRLDLSCGGRGFQQTLLLLAYMYANPGAVLLLDEPDAHLEILRQRQMYRFLTDAARKNGTQIIAASHSEILLGEAAQRDTVVAFVGKPHRIDDRGSQLLKSLKNIPPDHYYQAEQTGWVLYLEGSTDLAILQTFAERLGKTEAVGALEKPFVHYVANQPMKALDHFYGLREAVPKLKAVALFDRLDKALPHDPNLTSLMWNRREIENYFCYPETLDAYAQYGEEPFGREPLFDSDQSGHRRELMKQCIKDLEQAMKVMGKPQPWENETKVSDDFLMPLFSNYFEKLGIPNIMKKNSFHQLAHFMPVEKIDPEVNEKLDTIVTVAESVGSKN